MVGSGLAGASAAATLGELGYNVKCFCFQDSPRRAHSIAAQGGINAAKNYHSDGDSVFRLFYDTVKGGDFRSREAERVPAGADQREHHRPMRGAGRAVRARIRRDAGQPIVRRRAGVANLLRARADGPAVAAGRLSGAGTRRCTRGASTMFPRTEMLDLVVIDGQARGIVTRNLVTGTDRVPRGRRGGAGDGRLRQRLLSVDQRQRLELHGHLARVQARRGVRESVLHADSSHLHSGVGALSVEADADERVAAQRRAHLGAVEGR